MTDNANETSNALQNSSCDMPAPSRMADKLHQLKRVVREEKEKRHPTFCHPLILQNSFKANDVARSSSFATHQLRQSHRLLLCFLASESVYSHAIIPRESERAWL